MAYNLPWLSNSSGTAYWTGTVRSTDGSLSDVQAKVDASSSRDIVEIPAGSFTWTGLLTIPNTKGIMLRGAGIGQTNITHDRTGSQAKIITINPNSSISTRITGITFLNGTYDRRFISINVSSTTACYRIDNCEFYSVDNAIQIDHFGGGKGLIDNNYFESNDNFELIHVFGDDAAGWTNDVTPGSDDACYIEDNTFVNNKTSGNFNGGSALQSYDGARTVARYNYCDYSQIDQHGTAGNIGARWWEFYENTFNIPFSGANQDKYFDLRGGSGVVYNNYKTGFTNAGGGGLVFREEDTGTYPLDYQIGRGKNQTLDPVYCWDNDAAMSVYVASGPIEFDRDVYESAKSGYTPYTYPHPVRSLT